MFLFKLWNPQQEEDGDIFLPVFSLVLPQKTLKRLGVGASLWEQFLLHCINVDVHNVDELNQFIGLKTYVNVLTLGMRLCGSDQFLYWYVKDTEAHHFGPVGLAFSTAPTVQAGLTVWLAYQSITAPSLSVRRADTHKNVELYFDSIVGIGAIQDAYLELCMLFSRKKLIDISNGKAIINIRFSHKPTQPIEYYQKYFGVTPEMGGDYSSLVFERHYLTIENDQYTPILYDRALFDCENLEQNYRQHKSVSHRVRSILLDGARQNEFYCLESVAGHMSMSVRTLTRRLKQEEASFRDMQTEVRLELAKKQLQNTLLPIKAICSNAGFSNVSAFSRAFRKYMKVTPSVYRQLN